MNNASLETETIYVLKLKHGKYYVGKPSTSIDAEQNISLVTDPNGLVYTLQSKLWKVPNVTGYLKTTLYTDI